MRFSWLVLSGLFLIAPPRVAAAFCRTATCAPPADFTPTATSCAPASLTTCVMGGATVKSVPLFWKSTCVGYSVQRDASRFATLEQATAAAAGAFAAWSGAKCPAAPTMKGEDLGPVACGDAAFNLNAANQNVIVFRDSAWPHKTAEQQRLNQASPTVALTTVSFNRDTGEILDADIELNTADHKITVTDTPGTGVFDLESVLTHEAGHFLGIAHSSDAAAVMYFQDEGGSSKHRALGADDNAAACEVYPPAGPRPVAMSVDPSGFVAAGSCSPTPRNGLSSTCAVDTGTVSTSRSGCAAGPGGASSSPRAALAVAVLALAYARRRRRAT